MACFHNDKSEAEALGRAPRHSPGPLHALRAVKAARSRRRYRSAFLAALIGTVLAANLYGQEKGPVARWSFSGSQAAAPVDSIHGIEAKLGGFFQYVPGASGDGLRFDGYTTSLEVPAQDLPAVGRNGFTVEAWVALNTLPWNWVPILDDEQENEAGFFLGIDAFGHLGLAASIDGQWRTVTSSTTLPLKKWAHVAGSYRTDQGHGWMRVYVDGVPVGQLPVQGRLSLARPADIAAGHADIIVGRVRKATLPFPEASIGPRYPVWYSLDGILDELELYDRGLSSGEIASAYAAMKAPPGDVLPWQKMPSGPPGAGRFGAYYTTLHYQDTWDRMRRIGPDSDVVVRFDSSPVRLVFWQGTNYIPAWVTENDKWYTDEFLETWESGCPLGGDCEPMSDKQSRYSHVDILESNDARAVIHWRYALAEVEKYQGAWPDPRTGWFDWVDEYWTVYPDGVAVRKQVLHSTEATRLHEWQETIVLHQPGSTPDDDISPDAITLENMQGATRTYTWKPKLPGDLARPHGPPGVTGPPDPNIQVVNMKSLWKPFQVVSPQGSSADIYNNDNTYFNFLCWNHWPVAQIASSLRPCIAADRASHTSLSHLYWKVYASGENTQTKILMDGLTTKSPAELLPIAKSWLSPPTLKVEGEGYRNDGYDPTQRAFVLTRTAQGAAGTLTLTLQGSEASPAFDPAFVVKGWGEGGLRVEIDGKPATSGKSLRVGYIHRLEGTDLVIWMQRQSSQPLHIEISSKTRRDQKLQSGS